MGRAGGGVMNRKVFKVMIALVVIFLTGLYVLKIFMPEQFVLSVENEIIITIGTYIDNNAWAYYLFGILTSFITYWLYLCAVCRRWYLKWYEILTVLVVIGGSIGLSLWDANVYSAYSVITFIVLPLLFKSDLKTVAVVFSVHSLSQTMSLTIRNLPLYMITSNSLTLFLMAIECYFWLLLFYIYFNYKKENQKWDGDVHLSTENKKVEKKEKLQKSTEKSQVSKQTDKSTKEKLRREKRKKNLRKLKLSIKDFITDELWIYVIIIGSIALCSWLFNRWLEGLMFVIAHLVIRRVFDKQFHFSETAYCLILTLAIVWFAIPITLSVTTSLLSSIIIAFIVCFVGYVAQDRVDLLKEKRMSKRFNFATCTKEDVIKVSNALGYNKDKQDLAVMFFADRLSNKQIWQILCNTQRNIEWDTVKKYKYRMSKDFKNYIKPEEE